MPMKSKKKVPLRRHAEEKWEWEEADAFVEANPDYTTWGMLLDGLCVVDCDDEEMVAWFEGEMGNAMEGCAVQETYKGRHYVFLRPDWADEEGYYDGARQVKGRNVDLKTLCSTGSRGLLSVAPTDGKKWLKAPWELGAMAYMSASNTKSRMS
eukprot:gene20472-biopygen29236